MRIALALHRAGLRSDLLHGLGFASIVGSVVFWGRSGRAQDRFAKARAERLAIFVGLWPPTLFLLGKVMQDLERTPADQADHARRADEGALDDALRAA
jgi:hypothetical protein